MPQTVTAPGTPHPAPAKPLHIFAPGTWTTMAGETIEFSAADLRASAAAFNPARAKAPIVIGHPATDDPAQGWVASLHANERGLFATPAQVDPAFAQAARAGRWGTVSAKFYRPSDPANPVPGVWYLRHVGMLGAQSPALKGLDDPAFAQHQPGEDDGCVAFAQGVAFGGWEERTQASLWRAMREFLLAKFGREETDAVIPSYQVQSLEEAAQAELLAAQDAKGMAFAEASTASPAAEPTAPTATHTPADPTPTDPTPISTKEAPVSPEEKAALLARNTELEAQLAASQAERAQQLAAQRHAANLAFCEALGTQARLLPASQPLALALLDHLGAPSDTGAPVQFGEGEAKASLVDAFKAFLAAQPAQVQFGEVATGARAAGAALNLSDGEAIAARASAYQAQAERDGRQLSHAQAVAQVVRGG